MNSDSEELEEEESDHTGDSSAQSSEDSEEERRKARRRKRRKQREREEREREKEEHRRSRKRRKQREILVNLDIIDRVLQMYRESNRKQNGVFRKVILENPNFLFFILFDLSECGGHRYVHLSLVQSKILWN